MSVKINRLVSHAAIFTVLAAVGFFLYPHLSDFGFSTYGSETQGLPLGLKKETPLPETFSTSVPFSSQAPLGNWSQPWQDAREETSILMAIAWARGFELSPRLAAEEILKMVRFENLTLGYHRDTNLEDTARILKNFYRYENFEILSEGVSAERIKRELVSGNLVIVPLAGEILARENPYFTSPPHYHMVVITGFDDNKGAFIVNEPGTKHGKSFAYRYTTLMDAIHDWTGDPKTVERGRKVMLIVRPVKPAI